MIKKAYEIPNDDYLILSDDDIKKIYRKVNNDSRFINVKPLFPTMYPRGGVISALDKFEQIDKNIWRKINETL